MARQPRTRKPKTKFDTRLTTFCCGRATSHFDIIQIGGKPRVVCKVYPNCDPTV